MATLNLTRVFINLYATGAAVSAVSAPGRSESYQVAGETRMYAGGRRRSMTQQGELGSYSVTLLQVPRVDVETLRGWKGQVVQVRDHKGRLFTGTFFVVAIAEYRDTATVFDVAIALDTLTVAVGV